MVIDKERTIGDLAVAHPLATRVFARHGIDFCCGGGKPLREACQSRNLDPDAVVEEIEKELSGSADSGRRWDEVPLRELVDHIVQNYHKPLHEELPRLESMAVKVYEVHKHKAEETLRGVLSTFRGLKAELDQHFAKEEAILFPMIRSGQGFMAEGPIAVMIHEHDDAGAALSRLRELTGGYRVPAEACNTWRALWHGLAALETSLHEHIHLENNILFPRALAS
jgi:regulator of cell morphogenesis and NO signaling